MVRPSAPAGAAVHHRDVGAVRLLRHAGAADALSSPSISCSATRPPTGLYGGFTALVYLTPLIGGLLADRYLGSKRSVKFGAILMSLGYLTPLLRRRRRPSRIATIDGQRYEVADRATGEAATAISSSPAASACRSRAMTTAVGLRCVARGRQRRRRRAARQGGFEAGGERDPFFIDPDADRLSIGHRRQRLLQAQHLDHRRLALRRRATAAATPGFTIFYMGINLGSLDLASSSARCSRSWFGWWAGFGLAAIGMLDRVGAVPVRRRPARRLWRAARETCTRATRTLVIYRRARDDSRGLAPAQQPMLNAEAAAAAASDGQRHHRLHRVAADARQGAVRHFHARRHRHPDLGAGAPAPARSSR